MRRSRKGPVSTTTLRLNVLILMGGGYLTLIIIFIAMAWNGTTVDDAYDVVKGPLMALIGGSLAISKDLIPLGVGPTDQDADSTQNLTANEPADPDRKPGKQP